MFSSWPGDHRYGDAATDGQLRRRVGRGASAAAARSAGDAPLAAESDEPVDAPVSDDAVDLRAVERGARRGVGRFQVRGIGVQRSGVVRPLLDLESVIFWKSGTHGVFQKTKS